MIRASQERPGFQRIPLESEQKNMFPSMKIAKLFGINLFIHWTFWLLPLWVIFTWDDAEQMIPLWMNLLLIASLFGCVVLHELGHALAARHFGIRTRKITLSPLGGVAQLERMSHKPWEEFCIAVAGPLVNVVLAAILGVGVLAGLAVNALVIETTVWQFALYLLFLNLGMIVFNMLPAFPMDGGRVLRAILASSMGLLEGTRIAVRIGTVVAVLNREDASSDKRLVARLAVFAGTLARNRQASNQDGCLG